MDTYKFGCMRINDGESLTDYVARLRPIAGLLGIKECDANIVTKLINDPSIAVLANGRVLDKLLKPTVSLQALLEWSNSEDMKSALKTQTIVSTTCLNQFENLSQLQNGSYRERHGSNSSQKSFNSSISNSSRDFNRQRDSTKLFYFN